MFFRGNFSLWCPNGHVAFNIENNVLILKEIALHEESFNSAITWLMMVILVKNNQNQNTSPTQIFFSLLFWSRTQTSFRVTCLLSIGWLFTTCFVINQVRDAKIKFLGTLKQGNDEEKLEWKDLVTQLKVMFLMCSWRGSTSFAVVA